MALLLEDSFLPATLTAPPMTDEEFVEFCAGHPDLDFETTAEGELIVMPPPASFGGSQETEIQAQLRNWARQNRRGIATNSATLYVLPNGSRRSPDAAWTRKSAIRKLGAQSLKGLWHLCPDFVIELRSQSDRLRPLRAKMVEYLENGAGLGWLIDPEKRLVEVYRPHREPEHIENARTMAGEGPVKGFVLDLRTVWDPFAD